MMYEPDEDEAIERAALEGLSRRARGARFADRMPEEQRAGFTIAISAEPSGGVEEDEGGPNTPSGRHVEGNEPTAGATAMRKAHAREMAEAEATNPGGSRQDPRQANSNMGQMIRRYDIDEEKLYR